MYREPVVTYGGKRTLVAWVTDPALIESILLKNAEHFPKTRLDRRVLRPIVGEGLLTAEGESWRWQRKLASPLFRHSEILSYVSTMAEAAESCVDDWRSSGTKFVADVEHEMTEATFAVIARTVLAGIDEAEANAVKRAGRQYLDPITWEVAASLLQLPESMWHPGKRKMRNAARESRAIVHRLLDQRRANGAKGDDLVARMLAAKDPDSGLPMSDEQIVDNLATFLLAGHETTAKALTWTLYVLARAPQWQDACRQEIIDAIGQTGQVTKETIPKLEITQRVLKESMRIYPPVPVMTRVNADGLRIGDKDLPKPTLIVIPMYAIHRHRKLWENPDLFDPDRFLPEREGKYPRTQYMPFGYGQRVCIGYSFAMIEAVTILATILKGARVHWDGKHIPEPVSRVTLRPKGGMPLIIEPLPA